MVRYYVCGLGYDDNDCVTDYEKSFGDFDSYEESYELFVKVQCRGAALFADIESKVRKLLVQVEECKEDECEINCINVKNEWWIDNSAQGWTEFAVEVNNEKGFIRQIAVFKSYEEACEFTDNYNEPLASDEYLNIIFIDYNENGDEIAFGTVC